VSDRPVIWAGWEGRSADLSGAGCGSCPPAREGFDWTGNSGFWGGVWRSEYLCWERARWVEFTLWDSEC
jgi:hypothetical protein